MANDLSEVQGPDRALFEAVTCISRWLADTVDVANHNRAEEMVSAAKFLLYGAGAIIRVCVRGVMNPSFVILLTR